MNPSHGYAAPNAATNSPLLRIGLMTKQFGILASSNGGYQIVNADDGSILGEFAKGVKARIGLREGKFAINNTVVNGSRLRIEPQKTKSIEREDRLVEVNNRRYRGTVEIFQTQGATGMTAVNVVTVDEYVYGVLVRILTPEWPEQAIKAQAVTVRTFGLYSIGKHNNDGFDLCDTSDCLIYEGQTGEDPRILKAVEDTRGMVMIYQGYPAAAYSHISSGGYTENSETVFFKVYPYLRGVPDFDQTSPYYRWQKKISPQEMEGLLKGAGYNIGTLTAIEISKRMPAPVSAPDRGVSGRIRTITFIGKDGIASPTGEQIRELLSLPSTLFDINVAVPMASIESNITDSYGDRDTKQIQINLPPASTGGLLTDRPEIHRITGQKNETIFIDGLGWGNGVGLSQWGAKTMAEKAINPGADYYISILKHYFQGVRVDKWY
jgi:stage II sporulation protein D